MRVKTNKHVWLAVWLMMLIMALEIGAVLYLLPLIQERIPSIIYNYEHGRLRSEMIRDLLSSGVQSGYAFLVGQVVFSLIWFYLGYKVAVTRRKQAVPTVP